MAVAALAILAGHQLLWWWQAVRARCWRPAALSAVLLLIALLIVNRQRDFPTAIEKFSQALAARWLEQPYLASLHADARFRIGLSRSFLGHREEARDTLARLLADLHRDPQGVEAEQVEEIARALRQLEQELAAPADTSATPR